MKKIQRIKKWLLLNLIGLRLKQFSFGITRSVWLILRQPMVRLKICMANPPTTDGETEDLIAELIREVDLAAFKRGLDAKPENAMAIKLGA